MVRTQRLSFAIFLLVAASALWASASITGDLHFRQAFQFNANGTTLAPFTPEIGIVVNSPPSTTMRGEIALGLSSTNTGWDLAVKRAFLKARLPYGRLTVGKAPLPWGDGLFFNVANLMGSDPLWLSSYYLPLGALSFAEIVYLPAVDGTTANTGGRLYVDLETLKVETGYLASLDGWAAHRVALSVQGHLMVDWWASVSAPPSSMGEVAFSGGLLHTHNFLGGQSLSFRPEVQVDLNGTYRLALQGVFTPSLGTNLSLLATFDSVSELLLVKGGGSLLLPEALTLSLDLGLYLDRWVYSSLALELGCSWRF